MTDIFLSYASEDRKRAQVLVLAFEKLGWSVFWDLTVPPGLSWDEYIGSKLEEARCVVVAWSAASIGSEWVREEAREGKGRKVLIPVFFEKVKPPFGFGGLHAVDLTSWRGGESAAAFRELVKGIERVLGAASKKAAKKKAPAKAPAKKPAPKKKTAATTTKAVPRWTPVIRPILRLGEGAPTWEEDERLNRRIFIEGGEFLMGSPEGVGDDQERPQHRVTLSPIYIQEHPVTNEEYRRLVSSHKVESGTKRHPVVKANWAEAKEYAEWLGGSLPTEAQWEYAAGGKQGRTYPWGEEKPTCELANYSKCGKKLKAVGSHPTGTTPEGVEDLAGNVWDWCRDWHGDYLPGAQTDPLGPQSGSARVLRGGSWYDVAILLRGAHRYYYPPEDRFNVIGFRVVWSSSGGLD